jgi:putative transposase
MIEPEHPKLPIVRQCELLGLARASYYHRPEPETDENLRLMRVIDETYLAYPVFGSRQMARWLRRQGYPVNRKRVRRLMHQMGLEAIYQKPNTSRKHPYNPVFRYLLRRMKVERPNQVWAADITYIPIQGGFIYLCAVMDWYSRAVLAWELSNTLDAGFCARAAQRAIAQYGVPEIFNTDQLCSAQHNWSYVARAVMWSHANRRLRNHVRVVHINSHRRRSHPANSLPSIFMRPAVGAPRTSGKTCESAWRFNSRSARA